MMRVMLYEAAQTMLRSKKWSWLSLPGTSRTTNSAYTGQDELNTCLLRA
jgi:hypothetical protein